MFMKKRYLLIVLLINCNLSRCICQIHTSTLTSQKDTIKVLSINKHEFLTEKDTDKESKKCLNWKLNKNDIKNIIKMSKPFSGYEIEELFYYLPCEYKGDLILSGKQYHYVINAASTIFLSNNDTSFYLGCSSDSCKNYFIMQGGNPQRDVGQ